MLLPDDGLRLIDVVYLYDKLLRCYDNHHADQGLIPL